tara:strand:+ start:220 stop:339 length:120 start_codon:yes stop_codon:yes gene_type:complete
MIVYNYYEKTKKLGHIYLKTHSEIEIILEALAKLKFDYF